MIRNALISTLLGVGLLATCTMPVRAQTQPQGQPPQGQVNNGLLAPSAQVSKKGQSSNNIGQQFEQTIMKTVQQEGQQLMSQVMGALKVPDLQSIFKGILGGGGQQNDGGLSESLEGRDPTFDMSSDNAKNAVRQATLDHAQNTELGQDAQNQLLQELKTAQGLTDKNTQLGQDSQKLDVSQQILQNISLQLSQSAPVQQSMYSEMQKTNLNAAVSQTIETQAAKELSATATTARRQANGDAIYASKSACLGFMPGGTSMCGAPNSQ